MVIKLYSLCLPGVALLANAPERLPEKKKKTRDENDGEAVPFDRDGKSSGLRSNKAMGRAAKSRAVARGDNLARADGQNLPPAQVNIFILLSVL